MLRYETLDVELEELGGELENSPHEPIVPEQANFEAEDTKIMDIKAQKSPQKMNIKFMMSRNSTSNGTDTKSGKSSATMSKAKNKANKQWVHPPESLLRGHIVYSVKFLGHVEVDQPKGTDVVREAIRKMKFNKQLKKAEGQKLRKVELTISVDGVTVQEPKIKFIQHQYPLHRISYCADDKTDKKMFTFIAKEGDTNKHQCFVFDSDKCAEEITLTIGQAFDLAYRKFLESSSKDMDTKKQFLLLQKKVQQLTEENLSLKARVADLERLSDPKVLEEFDNNKKRKSFGTPSKDVPVVGRRLENLLMSDHPTEPYTNGTSPDTTPVYASVQRPHHSPQPQTPPVGTPVLAPPPPVPTRSLHSLPSTPNQKTQPETDLFGATPFTPTSPTNPTAPSIPPRNLSQTPQTPPQQGAGDPFGMGSFNPSSKDLDQQIQNVDKELMDLHSGFSRGISFGTDDFSLADLDPLNQK